jgi:hypothetical protein
MTEERRLPRYPIYIPSKGRADVKLTAAFLDRDGVPFHLVVEPQEADAYIANWGEHRVLVLPFSNLGQGVIPARNWIKAHATAAGYERHWQLDDNMQRIGRRWQARRFTCHAGIALAIAEDFTDRYTNVAISGLNYEMFLPPTYKAPPFFRNARVYSCSLVLNNTPFHWRGRYNEDTDYCLQALAAGWCTILFNAFFVTKIWTMQVAGGNTAELYQGDGRLKMARSLERVWPGVVTTDRRFQRPQHVVADSWRKFDTPLQLRPDLDLSILPAVDEQGLTLRQVKPVQSPVLAQLQEEHNAKEQLCTP